MKIEKIFTLSAAKLKTALRSEMMSLGYSEIHNEKKFLYAEGNAPYLLVAHLDTVHTELPSIICYSKDDKYMMSPQGIGGDDRCGVYIILELIERLPFLPYVVFTMDEEIGGVGAKAFAAYAGKNGIPDLKYIVEYDRKGSKDCVFYGCDNQDFVDFVTNFGFVESHGTFSDISIIAPKLGVAAVNLSSGYYNPHTSHEYVSMDDMHNIITKSLDMLCTECDTFEYVEGKYSYGSDRTVSVSFVPAGMVYVSDYFGDYVLNQEHEIAIDEKGTCYRYSKTYGDLSTIRTDIYYADEACVPAYNKEKAEVLSLFY